MIQSYGTAHAEWGQESREEIFDAAADSSVKELQFLVDFKHKKTLLGSKAIEPGEAGIALEVDCNDLCSRVLGRTARPENGKYSQTPEQRVTRYLHNNCSRCIGIDVHGNTVSNGQGHLIAYRIFMHKFLTPNTREQWVKEGGRTKKGGKTVLE